MIFTIRLALTAALLTGGGCVPPSWAETIPDKTDYSSAKKEDSEAIVCSIQLVAVRSGGTEAIEFEAGWMVAKHSLQTFNIFYASLHDLFFANGKLMRNTKLNFINFNIFNKNFSIAGNFNVRDLGGENFGSAPVDFKAGFGKDLIYNLMSQPPYYVTYRSASSNRPDTWEINQQVPKAEVEKYRVCMRDALLSLAR